MNRRTLQELSKSITSGITPFRGNPQFWVNGSIPWLKTEQLGTRDIYDTNEKITEKALSQTSIKLNPVNTISIAMYGEGRTRGNVSILRKEMTTNQACCNVVLDQTLADCEYVYYFLKNQYLNLRSLSSGVRKNLNSGDIKGFTISLPDTVVRQKKIAAVLSSLDAKIELNNRINDELEGMAKLLYDYWFVQHDFPISAAQAAALGKPHLTGKPYRSSGCPMVYNPQLKREIPVGWEVKKLCEVESNIITGKTPPTADTENFSGDIPFICIGDVRGNMHVVKTELTLSSKGASLQKNKFIPKGAICVTCIASPGLIGFATRDSQTNQQLNSIVCDNDEHKEFLYFYLKNHFTNSSGAKMGNTFANMNKADFSAIPVLLPVSETIKFFSESVRPLFDSILNNSQQNQELAQLRDWLLPMLMNGQVTVG